MADNIFVLDDGTKEITIKNKFDEEICKIHIRAGDLSILDRYNDLTNGFAELLAPLSEVHLNNDGTSDIDSEWVKIKAVEKDIIERLNTVFDSKDISNIFNKRNAFSTVGGEFYVERVVGMLGQVVNKEIEAENNQMQKRLEKYTRDLK